jgi:hypothetical protein
MTFTTGNAWQRLPLAEKNHIRDDYRQLHHINSMVFRVIYVCIYMTSI